MPRLKAFVLTGFFVVCAVAAVATHVWRQRVEAEFDPRPLFGVISDQFQACRSDDFGRAYDQASRAAQEHFTLVQYVSKIRTEYGRISRVERIQFGTTSLEHHRAVVQVFFLSARDQVTPALFTMIQEGGSWRIENFEILDSWPLERRLAGFSI